VNVKAPEQVHARAVTLLGVGLALLALTTLSFVLSTLHLGHAGLPVALGIAATKSVLIGIFFMHLIEQRASNALVICGALLFVAVLLTVTILETMTRFAPTIPPGPFIP
jgi:cytochrome c oxidase subunit 4